MAESPYLGKSPENWKAITEKLLRKHPLKEDVIVDVVLKSWKDIFNSSIGSFYIGKEIEPTPQIMSFLLHELVAHYLSISHPGIYKVGTNKNEKDIHCLTDIDFSVEIKASSHPNQIYGNRSYAQPATGNAQKQKNGYYITVNFEKFDTKRGNLPQILLIRFGYLEHSDWIAQSAATGQQARLRPEAYMYKLKLLYEKD